MKRLKLLRWLLLASVTGLLTSCSSLTPNAKTFQARFHEGASANLVLHFYSWDTIHMTRPDSRENGFLPLLNRDAIARKIERRDLQRDLAVVVMGFMFTKDQESALFQDWRTLLGEHGFRRVVMLRANLKKEIDGLPVLYDSATTAAYDDQSKIAATFAALPASLGANVANPSGSAVR